jgi:hypothetical protein
VWAPPRLALATSGHATMAHMSTAAQGTGLNNGFYDVVVVDDDRGRPGGCNGGGGRPKRMWRQAGLENGAVTAAHHDGYDSLISHSLGPAVMTLS